MTIRRIGGRRWSWIGAALLVFALLAANAATLAPAALRAIGAGLVASDPPTSADLIVIALDSGAAGALEAADLVHSGIATRVAVFTEEPLPAALEFERRGLPYEDAGARQIRYLETLGVQGALRIAQPTAGSHDEADALPAWCRAHQVRSVVFVSATDHSRRLRRVLSRSLREAGIDVRVRPARHSDFDPDTWWTTRSGRRIAIVEWQKLLLDLLVHPYPA